MIVKGIVEEDFINYHLPSMYIVFPKCDFKCGLKNCQNHNLINAKNIIIDDQIIVNKYINNPISHAIVIGGLEPFDSFEDLLELIAAFRFKTKDDIVIYTGYEENEILDKVKKIIPFSNIIIKFGRFLSDGSPYFNEDLGVILASRNQYTVRYY